MLDVWWLLVKSHLEDGAWVTPPNRLFRESVDQPAYPKMAILGQSSTHFTHLQLRVNWFGIPNRPLSLTTRRAEFYSLKIRATFEVAVMWCCFKPGSPFKAK
jgi:hypothetical protein